jgi:putative nucleotidyltransferase with HDIG domain
VRDAFVGGGKTDLDVATPLDATQVKSLCEAAGLRVVATGIQHGTVLVVVDGVHIETTTFREPSGRDSHTTARTIERDLSGRDFTINAIAFDLRTRTVIDPFDGVSDLSASMLRAVGDARERFDEDPLRILRMIRFGAADERTTDTATLDAARELLPRLAKISVERIRSELDKILLSKNPAAGFRLMAQIGALPYTVPELIPALGFEQNRFHIHDVFEHTMWVLERTPADLVLRWAAIFHDVGKPHTLSIDEDGDRHFYQHEVVSERQARERMHHLRFSNEMTDAIALIVRQHMRPLECGAPGVRRIMRDLGGELERWRRFKAADTSPTMPESQFTEVSGQFDRLLEAERTRLAGPAFGKLAVSGSDIIALGVAPGPKVGQVLKALEEMVLDDPSKNERESLLTAAKARLGLAS